MAAYCRGKIIILRLLIETATHKLQTPALLHSDSDCATHVVRFANGSLFN
jgi:hypothetical protein